MKKETWFLLLLGTVLYLIVIIYGIKQVYTAPIPPSKKVEVVKSGNKIAIAHSEIFGVLQRPPVIFDHQKHVEVIEKEGKKEWDTCKTCHRVKRDKKDKKEFLVFDFPKEISKKDYKGYMNAYHKECIGCHKQRMKENKKTGPVTCGDCHKENVNIAKFKYPVMEFDFKLHDEHEKKLKDRTKNKTVKETCKLCHHTYDLKTKKLVYQNGTEESCYYCHDLTVKKRGPELSKILKITSKENDNIKKVSHIRCLNCHLEIKKEIALSKVKAEKVPPIKCVKCHTGKYRSVKDLKNVPRPDRAQKDIIFINVKNAKMKGVPFDHKAHEYAHKTCRECHHEGLKPCKDCHTLKGSPKGDYINLAEAYHSVFSDYSCVGCHNRKIAQNKDCMGCHIFIPAMDVAAKTPDKEMCAKCHTGKKQVVLPSLISTAKLDPKVVKSDIEIKVLEKDFKPAKFPHRKIIDDLVKVSNNDKLSRYFHGNLQTVCRGCHHQSKKEAEVGNYKLPACINCHSIGFDPLNPTKPKLMAAYHQQCIGCHDAMKLKKPTRRCTDCHAKKEKNK